VDQSQIRVGESTTLRWETNDAVRIQITNKWGLETVSGRSDGCSREFMNHPGRAGDTSKVGHGDQQVG